MPTTQATQREIRSIRPLVGRDPAGRGRVDRGSGRERGHPPAPPPRSVRVLLWLALLGTLLAGIWGVSGLLSLHDPHPARAGEAVAFTGGVLRVDAVTARMPAHQMEGMDPDPIPAEHKRFIVDATVSAGSRTVSLTTDDFESTTPDGSRYLPVRAQLGAGTLPAGTSVSVLLVYDVPQNSSEVQLSFQGSPPITLATPDADVTDGGHSHPGESQVQVPDDPGDPADDTVEQPEGTSEDDHHDHDDHEH